MVTLKILNAFGAAIVCPVIWLVWSSSPIRTERLKHLLQRPVSKLTNDPLFVQETSLGLDIERSIATKFDGVKVIWAPQGAGKTTTVRQVIRGLQASDKIRGAIILSPPTDHYEVPSKWFRSALQDMTGNLLNGTEKLSQILPKIDGRPYVFVLDQIDQAPMDNDMRVFMTTLAEDSCLTKAYAVLAVCSDASVAKTTWDWNGREKIVLLSESLGRSAVEYRWDENAIEQWLIQFQAANPSSPLQKNTHLRDRLKEAAITAGTPGFLTEIAPSVSPRTSQEEWTNRAHGTNELWKIGEKMLEY